MAAGRFLGEACNGIDMRALFGVLVLSGLLAASPVIAGGPTDKPVDFWRASYMPKRLPRERSADEIRFTEPSYGQALADRLGVVNGTAEVFHYQLDKGNNGKTAIDGGVGGNGVKLRMRW